MSRFGNRVNSEVFESDVGFDNVFEGVDRGMEGWVRSRRWLKVVWGDIEWKSG